MPCHQTVASYWNHQQLFMGDEPLEDFFDRVSAGMRLLMVPFEGSTYIPSRFRFCWILYLLYSHLEELVTIMEDCTLTFKFFCGMMEERALNYQTIF